MQRVARLCFLYTAILIIQSIQVQKLNYEELIEEFEAWAFDTPLSGPRRDAKSILQLIENTEMPDWVLKEIGAIAKQCYQKDLNQAHATGSSIPPSYIPLLEKIIRTIEKKIRESV